MFDNLAEREQVAVFIAQGLAANPAMGADAERIAIKATQITYELLGRFSAINGGLLDDSDISTGRA